MIIMDITMPLVNGMEATTLIMDLVNDEIIEKPLIIACSSFADE